MPTEKPACSKPLPAVLRWAQRFLPHYFTDPPCAFHVELAALLADARKRFVACVAPRGHAKSTLAALAYPLWCLCEQRRRNIVIITQAASLATQFVRDIRWELETNEQILARYGDLSGTAATSNQAARAARCTRRAGAGTRHLGVAVRPRRGRWAAAVFTTATGITVQAKGTGASFRGTRVGANRPDLVICDDIEKDEHVASAEGRAKLETWLRRVVMPALAPNGQLVVLGSLIHYDSLLANLRDRQRFPGWEYVVYRALEARRGPDGQFYREALWPARWPVERLEAERERLGTLAFEQEYQANPVDDRLRVFRAEWLRRYRPEELENRRLTTLMAVDPATGAAAGDFFALWIGSVDDETGTIYTRVLTLERIGIVEQVQRIVAAFEDWRPVKIGIEAVAYQVALKQILEHEGRCRGLYLPVVALTTAANKRARIEGSAPFFENGTFRLPPVLPPEVETQFLHFPKARHDDAPDVCAMGIELARSVRSAARVDGLTLRRNPFVRRGGW